MSAQGEIPCHVILKEKGFFFDLIHIKKQRRNNKNTISQVHSDFHLLLFKRELKCLKEN